MKSEWADYSAVQAECGNLSGNELTRNSSGNTRSQSSQLTEPLWIDPGLKSGISVCELNLPISSQARKKATQPPTNVHLLYGAFLLKCLVNFPSR